MKIFLTLLMLLPAFCMAEDFSYDKASGKALPNFIGEVKLVKGQVYKDGKGGVKEGTRLYQGDTLTTEDASFVRAVMVDQSTINLGPNSSLNFEAFKFTSNTDRQAVFNFVKGQLRSDIKHKAKDGDIRFRVKDAMMGVRGTQLLINHHRQNNVEISEFALIEGKVEVVDGKNVKYPLAANDRLVLVHDPKLKRDAMETPGLEPKDLELLKDENAFMPYFVIPATGSPLSAILTSANTSTTSSQDSAKKGSDAERQGTLHNLDKLNKQLKEDFERKK